MGIIEHPIKGQLRHQFRDDTLQDRGTVPQDAVHAVQPMTDIDICDPIAECMGREPRSGCGIGPLSVTPNDSMCRICALLPTTLGSLVRRLGSQVGRVGQGGTPTRQHGKDFTEPETTISNLITLGSLC